MRVLLVTTLVLCVLYCTANVPSFGYSNNNDRYAVDSSLSTANANSITRTWTYNVGGPVFASPVTGVVNGVNIVFIPSYDGWIHAIVQNTGAMLWKRQLSTYTGGAWATARATIAFYSGTLIFGDNASCKLFSVNAANGNLNWVKTLDTHPYCLFTQSPTISNTGDIYVGIASNEEYQANAIPGYVCCTFMGAFFKLSFQGTILWKFTSVPNNGGATGGYSGNGFWGSAPAIDYTRNSVYVTTGNTYNAPQSVKSCLASSVADKWSCVAPNNYGDSIISLSMSTGAINWVRRTQIDIWNMKCTGACTSGYSTDSDFMQGTIMTTISGGIDALIVVQKNGVVWCVKRSDGTVVWKQDVNVAYISFGSAVDANNVYIAASDGGQGKYSTIGGKVCTSGHWVALNKNTGAIVWQKCNPGTTNVGSPLTITPGGVLVAGSFEGVLYAFRASDGATLWSDNIGITLTSGGTAVTGNMIITGAGYRGTSGTVRGYSFSGGTPVTTTTTRAPTTTTTTTRAPTTTTTTTRAPTTTTTTAPGPTTTTSSPTTSSPAYTFDGCYVILESTGGTYSGYSTAFSCGQKAYSVNPNGKFALTDISNTCYATAVPRTSTKVATSNCAVDSRGDYRGRLYGGTYYYAVYTYTASAGSIYGTPTTTTTTRAPTTTTTTVAPGTTTTNAPTTSSPAYTYNGCYVILESTGGSYTSYSTAFSCGQKAYSVNPNGKFALTDIYNTCYSTAVPRTSTKVADSNCVLDSRGDYRGRLNGGTYYYAVYTYTASAGSIFGSATTTTTTRGPTTTTTRAPTSPTNCWSCPANYIHWYDPGSGYTTAPGGDQCACVVRPGGSPNCWSCPANYIHWYDPGSGYTTAPGGDQCACVRAPSA